MASPPSTVTTPVASNDNEVSSSFSEDKYKKLKRKLRDIIGTNDLMVKEYESARKKIKSLTYERNLLLDSIARMEHMVPSDDSSVDLSSDLSDDSGKENEGKSYLKLSSAIKKATQSRPRKQQQQRGRRIKKEPSQSASPSGIDQTATVVSAPPKRSKMSKIPAKTRRVQPIERDEAGNPILPQQIGVLTVLKLGSIEPHREAFHNERYIFPVGYTVSRTYPSMVDPTKNTVVTSTIVDGGDGPRFHVEAEDMPGQPIIANSATGAWTVVVRKSNEIRHRDHSNSASGPDYYGFKHPTIAKMIQDLPGATELQDYVWQPFEEMEPKAAKGVMAAAQKKRGNLEQMGSANRKGAASKANEPIIQANNHANITETITPSEPGDSLTTNGDPTKQDEDDDVDELEMDEDDDDGDLTGSAVPVGGAPLLTPSEPFTTAVDDEEIDELGASD
ncbi:hypothetical protein [Absidia glauca]|uniref:INO80 complex subunit F domain-containing protein n=1 Tax=Absidia glauca TaxID=4829 RepID=A0A163JL55_ABSGL|nr:hypothetical protein [Absidia glauca]